MRTGDKGRGRDGEELSNFEPGSDLIAKATVLAEGTAGPPDRRRDPPLRPRLRGPAAVGARREGGLGGPEAARPGHPHDGLAAASSPPKYREFGGSFIYPMGEDKVSMGFVVGLDYRDARFSVHDVLQELKTHPMVAEHPRGRQARRLGREDAPVGRLLGAARAAVGARAWRSCGDGAGMVNVPKLKGVHYAMHAGMFAAEAIFERLKAGGDVRRPLQLRGEGRGLRDREGHATARATCASRSPRASSWAARSPT